MEAVYYAVRANLRRLLQLHPQWTQPQYAQAVGMSVGWVKKWAHRASTAPRAGATRADEPLATRF